MSLVSNSFTLRVSAAPSSSLAVAAAALSSGTWGTWTTGNTFNPDPIGAGDTIFSYSQTAHWDSTRKVIQFFGGLHGGELGLNPLRSYIATYNDTTNQWTTPLVHVPNGYHISHGYYNHCVDPVSGIFYVRSGFGSPDIYPFNQDTRSLGSNFAEPSGGSNYGTPLAWHPTLGLIRGHYWGIFRRSGSSWVQLGGPGLIGDRSPVGAYNLKDNCVYMGGGFGSGAGQFQRINASGAITSRSLPSGWTLQTWGVGDGPNAAALVGGTATAKMLAYSKGGEVREYDEVANTWSSVITTLPSAITSAPNPDGNVIACVIPEYNCIVFFKLASMTAISTTAHIYKR